MIARLPVAISINLDAESKDSQSAGQAGLFGRHSYGRYGAREGVWRLLEVLRATSVKATFFVDHDDARRNRHLIDAIVDDGHEIAASTVVLDQAGRELNDSLEIARDTLAEISGSPPLGWRAANGLVGASTLPALARCGFLYDSSFQDDDLPYVFGNRDGTRLVELPVFEYLMDATFYATHHSSDRVRRVWFEELDAMSAAGSYVHLVLHSRGDVGSARAVRAQVVTDFIAQAAQMDGATFFRCDDLASAWRNKTKVTEPYPAVTLPLARR